MSEITATETGPRKIRQRKIRFVAHFSACRFFSVVVSSGSFLLPFFYPLISCCPIFPLPDFPAAQFSIAIFSVVIISDINFLLPFSPPFHFPAARFSVAVFAVNRYVRS